MIGLLFEVEPKQGHMDTYLDLAAKLRSELDKNPGVMFIDRYRSLDRPGVMLSHSLWRDEAHLVKWRANSKHYKIQIAGRNTHFQDYRLRIGVRCQHWHEQGTEEQAPNLPYNDPAVTPERHMGVVYTNAVQSGNTLFEWFESVYRPGEYLGIAKAEKAEACQTALQHVLSDGPAYQASQFLVSRDYGQHQRDEAPQFMD